MKTIKNTMVLCALLGMCAAAGAQTKVNQRYLDYIDKYKDLAIAQMLSYNIPASVTLAQGLLESGAGKSVLASKGNNHFGIKCHDWTGKTIYADDDALHECFRAYKSAKDSYEDHSLFLTGHRRYSKLFSLRMTDYRGWAKGLKECGYATSPTYSKNLIDIIETYRLYRFDSSRKVPRGRRRKKGLREGAMVAAVDASAAVAAPRAEEHQLYLYNKNVRLRARAGDTFRSLGKETGIPYRKLASYNERDRNDVLSEVEYVYLRKKQTKAEKQYKKRPHVVKAGDSMYSIAQQYGVTLESLYRTNRIGTNHVLTVGETLKVR